MTQVTVRQGDEPTLILPERELAALGIRAGDRVSVLIEAARRDAAQYPDDLKEKWARNLSGFIGKYGEAAVKAARLATEPRGAWDAATVELFGEGTSSQAKGGPRDAFLGLCEAGVVRGVPRGNYTRSTKNKSYALDALKLLREDPALAADPAALWQCVAGDKEHNQQMNVVISLWHNGLIDESAF
jgi:hypothetical protein